MKIASNSIRINVEEQGDGESALVFLHYWGGSSRTWRHVVEPLAAAYRTIAIDHRGWGDSDAPDNGYAIADMADDAAGVVEALGLTRFVLIGHSMGGKVAQLLASRRPAGLVGLVLVAAAPPTPLDLPDGPREMMKSAYHSRETVEATIDQVLTGRPLDPADREQVIVDSLRGAPQAKASWPAASSREDIGQAVAAIEVPVVIISGELDRVDPVVAMQSELLPRFPGARFHVLPGVGHLSPLEDPASVARVVGDFAHSLA